MSKQLVGDDPVEFLKQIEERTDGHAPGFDIAIYARPVQWLGLIHHTRAALAAAQVEVPTVEQQFKGAMADGRLDGFTAGIEAAAKAVEAKPGDDWCRPSTRSGLFEKKALVREIRALQPSTAPTDAICPDCRGERRGPDGQLCKRCGGTAQIRRGDLRPGEKAPFEPPC